MIKTKDPKWLEFKAEAAKFRNGPITALFTRRISILVTYMLRNTKVTPNMVTISSLIVFLAGMPFFLFGYDNYIFLVIGVVITQIAYVLDCSDGELARYKKMTSSLGAWLDSLFDRIKEAVVFLTMTLSAYCKYISSFPDRAFLLLIIGFIAFINVILVGYITDTKIHLGLKKTDSLANIGKKYLFGYVELIVFGVAVAALLDKFEFLLLFFAAAGPIFWMVQAIILIKKYKKQNN
jgi:phosphatidylglycerophosphate synthase